MPVGEVVHAEPVTISAAEYAELLECKRLLAATSGVITGAIRGKRSPIDRDPELATFLAERVGTMLVKDIRAACLARFGPDRTPSRSAIDRFRQRLRVARRGARDRA